MADDTIIIIDSKAGETKIKETVERIYDDFRDSFEFDKLDDFGFETGSDDLSWF